MNWYFKKGTSVIKVPWTGPVANPRGSFGTPEEYYKDLSARQKSLGYSEIDQTEYNAYTQALNDLGLRGMGNPPSNISRQVEERANTILSQPANNQTGNYPPSSSSGTAGGGTVAPPTSTTQDYDELSAIAPVTTMAPSPAPAPKASSPFTVQEGETFDTWLQRTNPIISKQSRQMYVKDDAWRQNYNRLREQFKNGGVSKIGESNMDYMTQAPAPNGIASSTVPDVMSPVYDTIDTIGGMVSDQQPSEEEMLARAREQFDPYFAEELALLQEYYGMQRRHAEQSYGRTMAYVGQASSALQKEYQLYLDDLETGKLRAGTDEQRIRERTLEDKTRTLEGMKVQQERTMENLQRSYIQRGGLFSGARTKSERLTGEDYGRQTEGVEIGTQRTLDDNQLKYERAMEDYLSAGKKKSAEVQSRQASLGAQSASAQGGLQQTLASADYSQKVKERDLNFQKEKALMEYVYGENAYNYLGL